MLENDSDPTTGMTPAQREAFAQGQREARARFAEIDSEKAAPVLSAALRGALHADRKVSAAEADAAAAAKREREWLASLKPEAALAQIPRMSDSDARRARAARDAESRKTHAASWSALSESNRRAPVLLSDDAKARARQGDAIRTLTEIRRAGNGDAA